ncbi:MAG: DUF4402 domain-containing protein [Lachnospiraceae bacterium]|nr:DUF4402 domain-containing protein [Lachnospiraceae bacterium]
MKYGSCLKKLKRILAVALALALLFNGWSNYDLSVKAEANEEEVESTEEEEQTAEEEVTAETEESTETQETQTVEETTETEGTSETQENTATTEETAEETEEAEETTAASESTETAEETEEEETESLTIVESFSLGVARLLGGLSPVAGGISVASVEGVTVDVTGGSSTIDKDDNSANTVSLTASATLDGGGSATVTSWSWSSDNENVATVPDNDASTVTVTAGSNVGDATITATATVDGVTYNGTYTVTVKGNNSVASVTLGSLGEVSVNDATDNSPSEALSYGDEVTLSSVTMNDTTMSSGEVSFEVSSSATDSTASTDVATKSSDTTFTVDQIGKFYLHITVAANGYYNESTAVYCFVAQPKVLKVEKLDTYSKIEKDSDGTTALSSDNEDSLYSITSYLKLTGQLSSDDDIKLAWSSNAGTNGEDIDWSGVTYDEADLTASVIKGFESLATYLTIYGTNKGYYTIDIDSLDKIELNAAINANKPDPDSYDMTTSEGTGGKVTISVDGSTAVKLTAGTEGNEANTGEGDKYWYSEDGCTVEVETGSGFAIVDENYADFSATAFTDGSTIFYITYTNGSAVTYYGPYTVTLQIDEDGPDLEVAGVELSNGGSSLDNPLYYNLSVKYTISATDEQSSVDKVYYYLATEDDEEVTATSATAWVEASLDQDSLTVTMPSYGYLYVKAVDKVGNVTVNEKPYCLLVLESNEPSVAVECTTNLAPENTKNISVTVDDTSGGTVDVYSGIQFVT